MEVPSDTIAVDNTAGGTIVVPKGKYDRLFIGIAPEQADAIAYIGLGEDAVVGRGMWLNNKDENGHGYYIDHLKKGASRPPVKVILTTAGPINVTYQTQ